MSKCQERRCTHAALPGPLALPRAAAAALVIRARSPRDDRSVSVAHVPDPVVDGTCEAPYGAQTPCSHIRFCCFQELGRRGRDPRARKGTAHRPCGLHKLALLPALAAGKSVIPIMDWSLDYGYCKAAAPWLRREQLEPVSAEVGDIIDVRYAAAGAMSGHDVRKYPDRRIVARLR